MGVNLRACRALACRGSVPHRAEVDALDVVMLGKTFSVGATFMTSGDAATGDIVCQDGVFQLYLDVGVPVFSLEGAGVFSCDRASCKVEPGERASVVAESDGKTVSVFFNGFEVLNAPLSQKQTGSLNGTSSVSSCADDANDKNAVLSSDLADVQVSWTMGVFAGYLTEVFADDTALSADAVRTQSYGDNDRVSELSLYCDFTEFMPVDRSAAGKPIRLYGDVGTVDLVRALVPGFGVASQMPGGSVRSVLASGTFTLAANVYRFWSVPSGDEYLVSLGDPASDNALALGVHADGTLFACAGLTLLNTGVALGASHWHFVSISVGAGALTVSVDGKQAGSCEIPSAWTPSSSYSLVFMGALDCYGAPIGSFSGYLDSVSLFNSALSSETLTTFASTPPFLYDSGLCALWSFSGSAPLELVDVSPVSLVSGAELSWCENTVRTEQLPPLQFTLPKAASTLSASLVDWQVKAASEVFFAATKESFGVAPTTCVDSLFMPVGAAKKLIENTLLREASVKATLAEGRLVTEVITKVISSPSIKAVLPTLLESFFLNTGLARAATFLVKLKAMWEGMNASTLVGAISITAVAVATCVSVNTWFEKNDPGNPDEDQDDDGISLSLESVGFYPEQAVSTSCRSVRIGCEINKPASLPEWVRNVRSEPVAYVCGSKGDNPVLKAQIKVSKVEKARTIKVSMRSYGEERLLGEASPVEIAVDAPGTYDFELTLSTTELADALPAQRDVTLQWFADSTSLGTTKHEVHVALGLPLAPWGNGADSTTVASVSVLRWVEAIVAKGGTIPEESKLPGWFAGAFVNWLGDSSPFEGSSFGAEPSYSCWSRELSRLHVDIEKLVHAVDGQALSASGAVDSCSASDLMVSLASLDVCGLGASLALLAGISGVSVSVLGQLNGYGYFSAQDVMPFRSGTKASDLLVPVHQTLCVGSGDASRYFDPYLIVSSSAGASKVVNLPLVPTSAKYDVVCTRSTDSYRDFVCSLGSTCMEITSIALPVFGELPLQRIIFKNGEFKRIPKRPPFDASVRTALPLVDARARCHSISFNHIEHCVLTVLRAMVENVPQGATVDPSRYFVALEPLRAAVTGVLEGVALTPDTIEAVLGNLYDDICSYDALAYPGDMEEFTAMCNKLVSLLNSCLFNLREGSANWNSAISDLFDPTSWAYIGVHEGQAYVVACEKMILTDCTPFSQSELAGKIPPPENTGIYLTCANDAVRISLLAELAANLNEDFPLPRIGIVSGAVPWATQFELPDFAVIAYSSSNEFPHVSSQIAECEIPIDTYLLVNDSWESLADLLSGN